MIQFEHLTFLFVAIAAAAGIFWRTRKIGAAVMVAAALAAMAGPFSVYHDNNKTVVFLIDRSESMQPADMTSQMATVTRSLDDKAAPIRIEFGGTTHSESESGTDIESALFSAMNHIGQNGRIYLFSDLLETTGDLQTAIRELSRRNISLELIVPQYHRNREVILQSALLPSVVTRNQTAGLEVTIESGTDGSGQLELLNHTSGHTRQQAVELQTGLNMFSLPVETNSDSLDYTLTVTVDTDTSFKNNSLRIQMTIHPKPHVCILGSISDCQAIDQLLGDYAYLSESTDNIPETCDLLVLADCGRNQITEGYLNVLKHRVTSGMGLLVLPGSTMLKDNFFSLEPFSELLPAKLHRQTTQASPDGCIVFIVDTSGSMRGSRLILAKGIIRSTFERLSEYDKAGIVEFYGNRKWAAPIQSAANRIDLNRAINRLTAGGGTVILPAIEEAYYGLLNTEAASRHIVVITDGGIESADYTSLLRRIREDNINISFVLTGPSTNTGFLSEMSLYGGGKFFHATDRFSLPKIDIKTLSAKDTGLFRQNSSPLSIPTTDNPAGISLPGLPTDFGYIPATVKLSAVTLLQAADNPVLTEWQFGLGKVIASHSDIFNKDGTEKLLQNLCRRLYQLPEATVSEPERSHDFEIKSCRPDNVLARQIGTIEASDPIERIQTTDLASYCLLVSFVCFLIRVIRRRMPRRAMAVVTAMLIICGIAQADYTETMKTGIQLYTQADANDLPTFITAFHQAQESADKQYALAWAVLTSQKSGRFEELETFLLSHLDKYTASSLNMVYAIQGDFSAARRLNEQLKSEACLSAADQKRMDRRVMDIALVSRQFETVSRYYQQQNDMAALMKVHLLAGRRQQALNIAAGINSEKLSSQQMFEWCQTLTEMGFHEKAMEKARILQKRKDDFFYESITFIAEMLLQSQQTDEAVEIILAAKNSFSFSDKQLMELAILLEKAGRIPKAIMVHQAIYERTKATDCLIRIAALEKMAGHHDRAYQLWFDLWQQCREPLMRYQITPFLLDAAVKNNSLVDLVITLEDNMAAGKADDKQIDLLVDIYTSVDDAMTPTELVKQYYGSDSIASLKQQYHICRRCKQYRQCSRILERLIERDAANAADYLQQLAIIAVERAVPTEALRAAEQLKKVQRGLEPELTAGLLAMLGRSEDAMDAYNQMIARRPDNYELWLLWAEQALQCSPTVKNAAVEQLSQQLAQSDNDSHLLVIVDALLNMQAPKPVLQNAYDKTLEYLEKHPGKVYLYRLAVDILAELDPAADPTELLLAASCYAPQRRLAFIREAMDSQGSLSEKRLDLAHLLVFMNWQCSPDQYIKLGQMFLENGDHHLAEYLFRCNSLLNAENKGLYLTIADVYQRRSDFENALAIVQEALALYPNDLQILLETAAYHEILGQFPQAFKLYEKAYSLTHPVAPADQNQPRSKNINPAVRYRKIAFEGMVITSDAALPPQVQDEYQSRMAAEPLVRKKRPASPYSGKPAVKDDKPDIDFKFIDMELEDLIAANVLDFKSARRINDIVNDASPEQADYLYEEFREYGDVMGQTTPLQYLMSALAFKLEKKQQAQEIIRQCYLEHPENRTIEFKLKAIFEDCGQYQPLAETMLAGAQRSPKSPHFWREITRLYYQAGDLEKAKWANAYASGGSHFVLQVLDYLFLYTKEQDIEKMKQYFRKYQVDCRRNDKYYALRWNYWDGDLSPDQSAKRQTAYEVLGNHPQLLDEFERYSKAVYPDRRDCQEYMAAYENLLATKDKEKELKANTLEIKNRKE